MLGIIKTNPSFGGVLIIGFTTLRKSVGGNDIVFASVVGTATATVHLSCVHTDLFNENHGPSAG